MAELEQLTIHTDGGARGNPGPAAYAFVIRRDGQPAIEEAECLGQTTNNQAEYTALVRALEHALQLGTNFRVVVYSDSELMVKQLRGEYRVKNEELRPLYEEAHELSGRFAGGTRFVHVRREHNKRADELVNEALDGKRTRQPRPNVALADTAQPTPAPAAQPRPNPAQEAAPAKPEGLHAEAMECLRLAGVSAPETVWRQLSLLLEKHLCSQLRFPGASPSPERDA